MRRCYERVATLSQSPPPSSSEYSPTSTAAAEVRQPLYIHPTHPHSSPSLPFPPYSPSSLHLLYLPPPPSSTVLLPSLTSLPPSLLPLFSPSLLSFSSPEYMQCGKTNLHTMIQTSSSNVIARVHVGVGLCIQATLSYMTVHV